ncbi:glutaredoxin 3 [Oceanospirillum multiglobuliferum]|uniref:Glutaredoxin n=1 Tax=Oceanospirillum multiglobuliferum TaxID=64969 RepID=A0A1T4RZM8_9GAMM|nr:glutaredoxin 3 [Oceanospirillum multiglobuliferum]OPX54550.1 glutaredoxin 3 [Oceanospirillum multiglobuliferum]SKA21469.1 glutaredoxin 3 [Oceanospirillum multiglobuliferum]
MQQVTIYSKSWCPFCVRAKSLLQAKKVAFQEIDVEKEPTRLAEMIQQSGRRTVPQIWVGDTHVGGCDDLFALESAGRLDSLLAG